MNQYKYLICGEVIGFKNIGEPYTIANPPALIKNLPIGAKRLFISAFNSVYTKTKNDNDARIAGWGAVRNKYKKVGGKWVAK